jgi:adenylylsulfate kinase-like enzyme
MTDAGLITLVSLISPFEADRRSARDPFTAGDFLEVFVDTPWLSARHATPRGFTATREKAKYSTSPGLTKFTKHLGSPRCGSIPVSMASRTLSTR